MATKKLTVEVDADASKAKRKIKRDLSGAAAEASSGAASGGAAPASSSAATKSERLAKSLERAGKNAEDFGKHADQSGRQISNAFKSLAGLGAGLAIGYAARHMQEGEARNRVEVAGAAVSGASVGAGFASQFGARLKGGLTAAIIGAGIAAYNKKSDQEKEVKDFQEGFDKRNKDSAEAKAWNERFRSMTEMPASFGKAEGLELLQAKMKAVQTNSSELGQELERLQDEAKSMEEEVRSLAKESKLTAAAEKESELQAVRSRIAQTEAAKHSFARQQEALQHEIDTFKDPKAHYFRESTDGTDSLQRVGAGFTPFSQNGSDAKAADSGTGSDTGRKKPWRSPWASLSNRAGFFQGSVVTPTKETRFDFATEERHNLEMIAQQKLSVEVEKKMNEILERIYNDIHGKGGSAWQ